MPRADSINKRPALDPRNRLGYPQANLSVSTHLVNYVSSRGQAPTAGFDQILLAGLAPDGGLYLPAQWPALGARAIADLAGCDYAEAAVRVLTPFLGGAVPPETFAAMVADAYAGFDHPATAPLVQIDDNLWLLELFHGPTLAFKDIALQLLGRLFDHGLAARGEHATVIGATSGDTGSAAIHACMDRDNIDIFILHPKGRVSEVQRRQMTTVAAANVHNIAIEGTFDHCQYLVKAMFNDTSFRAEMRLAAVNSINWARIMAQTVYYLTAAANLGAPEREIAFSVPTGNFGDVYAGYVASRMGLPVRQLRVATNRNDILARLLSTGQYRTAAVSPTLSPSMDIQVASNFERLLFDLCGRDGAAVARLMGSLFADGGFEIEAAQLEQARALFQGVRIDEDATLAEIARVHAETGRLIDPHTAVGVAATRAAAGDRGVPWVALATAHPAKFPDAVARATGIRPELPARWSHLMEAPERCRVLERDLDAVQAYIRATGRPGN